MALVFIVGLIGLTLHIIYHIDRRNRFNAMQRLYFDAMLKGEQFTDAQHRQIAKWLSDLS